MDHPEIESMGLYDLPRASSMRLCKRKKKLQRKKKLPWHVDLVGATQEKENPRSVTDCQDRYVAHAPSFPHHPSLSPPIQGSRYRVSACFLECFYCALPGCYLPVVSRFLTKSLPAPASTPSLRYITLLSGQVRDFTSAPAQPPDLVPEIGYCNLPGSSHWILIPPYIRPSIHHSTKATSGRYLDNASPHHRPSRNCPTCCSSARPAALRCLLNPHPGP